MRSGVHALQLPGWPRSRQRTLDLRSARPKLVDQLAELGVLEVTLIGGEVYLRDDWTEIVRAIRGRGMECAIVTGGRGFTSERARAAKKAGVMSVSVSLDGTAATHDALRALRGSHDAALASMRKLGDADVQVSGNTQIGRRNLSWRNTRFARGFAVQIEPATARGSVREYAGE